MIFVTILQGLPASGKSTWAKEQVRTSHGQIKRVNQDDLRAMMDDSIFSKDNEKFMRKIKYQIIWEALSEGKSVIVDDTHLNPGTINHLIAHIESFKKTTGNYDVTVETKKFDVPLEVCLERNSLRANKVPEDVIHNMNKKWLEGK